MHAIKCPKSADYKSKDSLSSVLKTFDRAKSHIYREISRYMNRDMFIARLTEIQESAGQLLSQVQASEHDAFAAHLYRSRREFRSACKRSGKSGKAIERYVISTFRIAESMGFKGELRQWEGLLRVGE